MTITIKQTYENDEYGLPDFYKVKVTDAEGKVLGGFSAWNPEPEDAILSRDLSFAYDAVDLFKLGYAAGKAGVDVLWETQEGESKE